MTTLTLDIKGMHCSSCSRLISMDLEDIGVQAVIDQDTNRGRIEFDQEKVTKEQVIDQIRKAGYDAVITSEKQA